MLEARRGHEGGARAPAFEQRVRRDRRPVREALDVRRAHRPGGRDDGLLLALRGGDLRRAQLAVREQHRVGERAADVDAEDRHARTLDPTRLSRALRRSSYQNLRD